MEFGVRTGDFRHVSIVVDGKAHLILPFFSFFLSKYIQIIITVFIELARFFFFVLRASFGLTNLWLARIYQRLKENKQKDREKRLIWISKLRKSVLYLSQLVFTLPGSTGCLKFVHGILFFLSASHVLGRKRGVPSFCARLQSTAIGHSHAVHTTG